MLWIKEDVLVWRVLPGLLSYLDIHWFFNHILPSEYDVAFVMIFVQFGVKLYYDACSHIFINSASSVIY